MSSRPRIAVVTISDRVSRGEAEDRSGPALRELLEDSLKPGFALEERLVSDDREAIESLLIELIDERGCCLVVTTGGTGSGSRDVTPEATAEVCERQLPGFGERMRALSVETVPSAILSRQLAGLRGHSLVVNVPGSPAGAVECLGAVLPAIPHGIVVAGGPRLELAAPPDLPH